MAHDGAAAALHTLAVGLRLLVVDNNAALRTRLVHLFGSVPGVEVVGTATDAVSTLAFIDREHPDVVTLDIYIPGNGVTVLEQLRGRATPPRVAVLTAFPTGQHRRRCLALGAELCLDKAADLDEVCEWLRDLAVAHERERP
jgi:DNA-binding NarL/FixJ family response regulator